MAIHAALQKLERREREQPETQASAADNTKLIYLICDEKDRKATIPVRKWCREQGFDVAIPAFEGDAKELRDANRELLKHCDAILLFYGAGDEAWKRSIDSELKKMQGYRGEKPLLAIYTYLAAPQTNDKEELIDLEEPNLINGLADFSETEMRAFGQAVNPHGETS